MRAPPFPEYRGVFATVVNDQTGKRYIYPMSEMCFYMCVKAVERNVSRVASVSDICVACAAAAVKPENEVVEAVLEVKPEVKPEVTPPAAAPSGRRNETPYRLREIGKRYELVKELARPLESRILEESPECQMELLRDVVQYLVKNIKRGRGQCRDSEVIARELKRLRRTRKNARKQSRALGLAIVDDEVPGPSGLQESQKQRDQPYGMSFDKKSEIKREVKEEM